MNRQHRGNNQQNWPMKRFRQDDFYNNPPPPPPPYMNDNFHQNGPPPPFGGGYNDYEPPKRRKREPEIPNHIILFTVMNPAYPITVDVLNTICQPYGNVLRIVIFKKNGVQAMVEFDSIDAATRTKDELDGAEVYSGCCSLRIEYAKPTKLNVFKNDSESWDFTNPNMGGSPMNKPQNIGGSRPPLLKEPQFGGGGMNGMGGSRGFNQDRFGVGGGPPSYGPIDGMPQGPQGISQQGAVLMVYGLPKDKMNADKLFNLFCLYGNVFRVKFLKSKEGCAMVQMGDSSGVQRCIKNLNNLVIFKNNMQLGYSKQAFLADVQKPYDLSDGTESFKLYMGNKNNRFMNPEMASKNRIQPPSKILHFFNTPPSLSEQEMEDVFAELGVPPAKSMRLFPAKTDRSSSGLLEFESVSDAIEALICVNHAAIPNPNNKFPFVMKLCFSSARQMLKEDDVDEAN